MSVAPEPAAITFRGVVIDRSGGKFGCRAPSATEVMAKSPAWCEWIRAITGWKRLEFGTLTIDEVKPLPESLLRGMVPLGCEPKGLCVGYSPGYDCFLQRERGIRRFFGARVVSGPEWQITAISYQDRPAKKDRLEVYSSVNLRTALGLHTNNKVTVEILSGGEWRKLRK